MAGRRRREVPQDLARVAGRFAEWPRSRVLGKRIPEPLWNCAVDRACQYGMRRRATALRVGCYELQKRLTARRSEERSASAVAFVGLPSAVSVGECVIEFESVSGSRMRVLRKGEFPDLIALGRSFWDAG